MTDNPFKIQIKTSITFNIVCALFWTFIISLIVFFFVKTAALFVVISFVVIFFIGILWQYLYLSSINYSVDTKNFTFKGGVISRFEKILPYSKIQHVITYESFWQRILGLASVSIETARESGMQQGLQYGRGNRDNSLVGMKNPLIPDLKKDEAEKLKNYIISASNLKYKPVAGI
jgi:membrane protein YdbS with pleckstrin-like domain